MKKLLYLIPIAFVLFQGCVPLGHAFAAITFDASSSLGFSATSSPHVNITIGAGTNNLVVVHIETGADPIAVKIGSTVMTKAISAATGTIGLTTNIWYATTSLTGAQVASATFSTTRSGLFSVSSYFGVDQTTPFDKAASSSNTLTTLTKTTTTPTNANALIFSGTLKKASGAVSSLVNGCQAPLVLNGGSANFGDDSYCLATSTNPYGIGYNYSANATTVQALAVFKSASAGSGFNWTDTSGDHKWSTANNWSGGSVPSSTDVAVFAGASSTDNCTIDANISVAGIQVNSDYSGTITQASGNTITAGTSGWTQAAGTFTGSSSSDAITVNGQLSLSGGTFTSTNGSLILAGATNTFSGFANNTGTVILNAASAALSGSSTFYNLMFGNGIGITGNNYFTVATGTVFTVNGSLKYNVPNLVTLLGGGEIDAKGDVLQAHAEFGTAPTSTFNLTINGTGSQKIDDQGYSGTGGSQWYLPSVTINKSSGSLNFYGAGIQVTGNWTNNNGNSGFTAGTSTILFANASTTPALTGSSTFNYLWFGDGSGNSDYSYLQITTGTVFTASNDMTFGNNNNAVILIGGGEADAKANVLNDNYEYASTTPTSTFSLVINGTGTQLITDPSSPASTNNKWYLPSVTVNKTAGIAIVSSTQLAVNGLTITAGEMNIASNTVAQVFESDGAITVSAGGVLSNTAGTTSTVLIGSTVTNNGLIFFDGGGAGCTPPSYISLQSTSGGAQRSWSGSGTFIMRYMSVQDQGGSASIAVQNGTSVSGNGGNWTFVSAARPQLVQSSSTGATSNSTRVTVTPSFWPHTGDIILLAVSTKNLNFGTPTDTAGNTYTLVTSSSFGGSPTYRLALYYAKNVSTTYGPFAVTANGGSALIGSLISAGVFEYTGITTSSSLDTYSSNADATGNAVSLTSLSATGQTTNEVYFGASTVSASTTVTSSGNWTDLGKDVGNGGTQNLYTEHITTTTLLTTAATWTSAASTSYAAIMGVFRSPNAANYVPSGVLDSVVFDTQVSSGTQLNSVLWLGTQPAGTSVKFQFAVSSNATSGAVWSFVGPDGTSGTWFSGSPGVPISLVSGASSYQLFTGYRYFRYRIALYSDPGQVYTPTVNDVIVNWSP